MTSVVNHGCTATNKKKSNPLDVSNELPRFIFFIYDHIFRFSISISPGVYRYQNQLVFRIKWELFTFQHAKGVKFAELS